MRRTRGRDDPSPVGRDGRAALVPFFNSGVDTGTVWTSAPSHEPILWRHVTWGRLFDRQVNAGNTFCRPMNRVVHPHLKALMPESPSPDAPIFPVGGARPNAWFQELCALAGVRSRKDI